MNGINFQHENQIQASCCESLRLSKAINFETGRCGFVFGNNNAVAVGAARHLIRDGPMSVFSLVLTHSMWFSLSLSLSCTRMQSGVRNLFVIRTLACSRTMAFKQQALLLAHENCCWRWHTAMMCERAAAGKIKSQVPPSPPPPLPAVRAPRVVCGVFGFTAAL